MSMQDFLPYLNIVLTVFLAFGGFFAWRKGYSQESVAIQERVILALKEEIATLRNKVDDLEKERSTQDRVIAAIRYTLREENLSVTIKGDFVTMRNSNTGARKVARIDRLTVLSPEEEDAI